MLFLFPLPPFLFFLFLLFFVFTWLSAVPPQTSRTGSSQVWILFLRPRYYTFKTRLDPDLWEIPKSYRVSDRAKRPLSPFPTRRQTPIPFRQHMFSLSGDADADFDYDSSDSSSDDDETYWRSNCVPVPISTTDEEDTSKGNEQASRQSMKRKREYVVWNGQMDDVLISVLYEQVKEGSKGDGKWKPQAYQAVVDKLRSKLGITVTTARVKNRITSWMKHYSFITDIQTHTKFRWDDERKMVVITEDDMKEWDKYCKEHRGASSYRNKSIEHWDGICVLFGSNRAVENVEEQHNDAPLTVNEAMTSDAISCSEGKIGLTSKNLGRDRLVDAITSFADSFKDYVESRKDKTSKPSGKEIYEVVSSVHNIQRHQVLRAVKKFMNSPEEFQMLKDLPETEKLDWIYLCLTE